MTSTPLQGLLNVDSGTQTVPDGDSSVISGFIELMANCFSRMDYSDVDSTQQSLSQYVLMRVGLWP